MKIGIDAYYLYSKTNTGIGYYVLNLLLGLSRVDGRNTYYLYTPAVRNQGYAVEILKNKRFHIVEIDNCLKKHKRLWMQHPSIKRQIRKDQLDIFLGGGEHFPLFFRSKTLFCLTIHDVVFKIFPDTVAVINSFFCNTLLRLCIRKASCIFTVSGTSKKEIVEHLHIDPEMINPVPNGIDIRKYRPKGKVRKEDFILFVGTIQPRKNLLGLIKAFERIHGLIDERLVVVGASGWKNSDLVEYIENLPGSVRSRIEFKGYLKEDELLELYKKARLFVAPSLHEGFGIIILEAMASGTPVVASRAGAIPEFFSDAALLVDPQSTAEIADQMLRVLKSRRLQLEMIRKGLETAKKLDVSAVARQYVKVFSGLEKKIRSKNAR